MKIFQPNLVFPRKTCKTANAVSFISLSYQFFQTVSHLGVAFVGGYIVFSVNSVTVETREVHNFRVRFSNLCNRSSIQIHSVFFISVFLFFVCFHRYLWTFQNSLRQPKSVFVSSLFLVLSVSRSHRFFRFSSFSVYLVSDSSRFVLKDFHFLTAGALTSFFLIRFQIQLTWVFFNCFIRYEVYVI